MAMVQVVLMVVVVVVLMVEIEMMKVVDFVLLLAC